MFTLGLKNVAAKSIVGDMTSRAKLGAKGFKKAPENHLSLIPGEHEWVNLWLVDLQKKTNVT